MNDVRQRGKHSRASGRLLALLIAALMLLSSQVAGAVSYLPVGPRGNIGISRPTVSQQFFLGQGESIERASMWLDGTRVDPQWDATGLVTYRPPGPLPTGSHTVKLSVEIATGKDGFFYDPIVSTFSFNVQTGAVEQLPGPGPEELRALQRVNVYRRAAGVPEVAYSDALGASARSHASYLTAYPDQQRTNAHGEVAGTSLFTGAGPMQRAQYWGYAGGVSEVVNFTDQAELAVDGWMDTLYHRIPLLDPGNTAVGYGLAGSGENLANVMEAGPGGGEFEPVLWPYPGQTGVPTAWDGGEEPDPFRLYSGVQGPVGYTITLSFGDAIHSLTLDSYSLTGPDGPVSVLKFDPTVDDHLTGTAALIPVRPLVAGARYTVTMAGIVDPGRGPEAYSRTWSFTTAPEQPPMVDRMSSRTVGGVLQGVTLEGSGFGAGDKVFLGGLPVENVQVMSDGRITFAPPRGLGDGTQDMLLVTPGGREVLWREFISDATAQFPAGSAFYQMPVLVHGQRLDTPALVYRTGTVLLPEAALTEVGAARKDVSEIGRVYWTWGAHSADYTLGKVVAYADGAPLVLDLPVQQRSGGTYVSGQFISGLTGMRAAAFGGQVSVGMSDLGGHWARSQVIRLLREGIVSGTGDGLFHPDDPLTRAAFVKLLAGARGLTTRPGDSGGFADTGDHWVSAQGYIGAAVQAGIVVPAEYSGRRFAPEQAISREEMAVMIARALGLDSQARTRRVTLTGGTATIGGLRFADAATWTRPGYIAVAVEAGIINGYAAADGTYTFGPFRQATRAEAVAMTVRTLDR